MVLSGSVAKAAEFEAAIGRTGFGRCHMDGCGFFIIDAVAKVGSAKDGTLFAISERYWSAEHRMRGENDEHEYDRPPVSVSAKATDIRMVFCSKSDPVVFDYAPDGTWQAAGLRPGDEAAVFGYNESAYQFYFAACHHFITKDPVSKQMAERLGYAFADKPASDNDGAEDKRQPMDMLK